VTFTAKYVDSARFQFIIQSVIAGFTPAQTYEPIWAQLVVAIQESAAMAGCDFHRLRGLGNTGFFCNNRFDQVQP